MALRRARTECTPSVGQKKAPPLQSNTGNYDMTIVHWERFGRATKQRGRETADCCGGGKGGERQGDRSEGVQRQERREMGADNQRMDNGGDGRERREMGGREGAREGQRERERESMRE